MSDSPKINGRTPFPLRALLVGLGLVVLINIGAPYSMFILKSSQWSISYLPLSVVFLFTMLVLLNALWKGIAKGSGFSSTEMILIFVMALVGASVPTWGTSTYLIAVIAAPQFFASPENAWAEKVVQHIHTWLVPQDPQALKWFYNGLPAGQGIPWGAWVVPLFWWISLVMAVFFFCHCLVAAFRRQWIEYERLPFPLMEVPQQLIDTPKGSALPGFVRRKVFWAGFAIPFFVVCWNMVTYFTPAFPPIPTELSGAVRIGREFPSISTAINFAIVGFTFFVNLDVSFSLWFFTLITMFQEGLFNKFGYAIAGRDVYTHGHPAIGWQSFGAMVVLVLNLFWMARSHFAQIWRKARTGDPDIDDSGELMSYRGIVVGAALSMLYIVFWLWRSGMSFPALTLFILATVILYTGITRVVMEGGLLFVRGPLVAQTFAGYALGGPNMSLTSHVSLGLSYGWHHELKGFFMTAAANSSKIADRLQGGHRRSVTVYILLAAFVAIVVSMVFILYMGYSFGAYNYGGWIFGYGSQVPYVEVLRKIDTTGPDWTRLGHAGIGGAVMALLTFMRYRFSWWPIHPIGMPVGVCSYPVNIIIFSIFIAWLAKWIILRTGGIQLYHKAQPFFIGIILGHFTGIGLSFVVDMIWFPGQGHPLYGN
ncbi:MAG: hypothetical protein GKR89_05615 [Candidatus Latescibacteria bacterium]|nr:hypothetical protein [Candidatus Latescibacterota bacterium]